MTVEVFNQRKPNSVSNPNSRPPNPSSHGSGSLPNRQGGQIMFYAGFLYRRFGTRHLNELTEQQRRSLGLR